jgi:multiple sugar transport system substrate-binding protein
MADHKNPLSASSFTRRGLLTGALGVSGLALLAACAPTTPRTGPTSSSKSKLTGNLRIQESFNLPAATQMMQKYARQFMDAHPGVNITVTNVPYANLVQTTLAGFSAGNLPDIIQASSSIGSVNFSQLGMFVDLKDLISKKTFDNFVDGSFQEIGTLGLPIIQSPEEGVWYLKDAFESAGIKAPPVGEAWTWDEMIANAKKLTKGDDQYGFVERGQAAVMGKSLIPYGWSFGTDWVLGKKGDWSSGADSKAMRDAIQLNVDLTREDHVRPASYLGWGLPQAEAAWAKRQVAMFSSGMWWKNVSEPTNQLRYPKDYDVMLFPTNDPKNRYVYTGFDYFHITKASENPELAAEFLEFMFAGTRIAELEAVDAYLPAMTKSNLSSPVYSSDKFPLWATRYSKWSDFYRTLSTNPHYSDIMSNSVVPAVQSLVQTGSSVSAALKTLGGQITTKLSS